MPTPGHEVVIWGCRVDDLKASITINRRAWPAAKSRPHMGSPDKLSQFFDGLRASPQERFVAAYLDTHCCVLAWSEIGVGSDRQVVVNPSDIFRPAILLGSGRIAVVHNHPTGNPHPSEEDQAMTSRLVRAGRVVGIEVLDHVVLGEGESYFSFKTNGCIDDRSEED